MLICLFIVAARYCDAVRYCGIVIEVKSDEYFEVKLDEYFEVEKIKNRDSRSKSSS